MRASPVSRVGARPSLRPAGSHHSPSAGAPAPLRLVSMTAPRPDPPRASSTRRLWAISSAVLWKLETLLNTPSEEADEAAPACRSQAAFRAGAFHPELPAPMSPMSRGCAFYIYRQARASDAQL